MANLHTQVKKFWPRLTRLEKLFLVLALLEIICRVINFGTGSTLPLQGLLDFLFIPLAFIFSIKYLVRFNRRMIWSLRNRLIITYVFIGVIPIVLILAMLTIGMYVLMGQMATYLITSELTRHNETVRDCAYALGWHVADHLESDNGEIAANQFLDQLQKRVSRLQAIVHVDEKVFSVPAGAGFGEIPGWSHPSEMGLVRSAQGYVLAAHGETFESEHQIEVFAYEPVDSIMLEGLLPQLASVSFLELEQHRVDDRTPEPQAGRKGAGAKVKLSHRALPETGYAAGEALAAGKAWWDIVVRWGTPVTYRLWESTAGVPDQLLVRVISRPSVIIRHLFSTMGPLAGSVRWLLYFIGGLLLLVEIAFLVFGVSLTRTITRSVADLYEATRKINVGDFSSRIAIRSNDQLSELAASFNRMTESIERLIIESKEKERLESELAIAREVQSQLFPKGAPRLSTLELAGSCSPARMVSGDYYDFIPINSTWTALAIGDIAGKGISAALLMATIQSSLRAQLNSSIDANTLRPLTDVPVSTSRLAELLNSQLYESTSPEKFATFYIALYDDLNGRLLYTNAGHLPPILVRQGRTEKLEVSGMVLGAFPDQPYEESRIDLQSGDLLVAYTDGITEPENEYGEEFGEQRLSELLIESAHKPLEELVKAVTSAVEEWNSSPEQQDDMTLLLIRKL